MEIELSLIIYKINVDGGTNTTTFGIQHLVCNII